MSGEFDNESIPFCRDCQTCDTPCTSKFNMYLKRKYPQYTNDGKTS